MNKLVLIGLVALTLIIAGCTNQTNQAVCNKPYILVGTSCCLDQNNNKICDKDEANNQIPQTQAKTENSSVQGKSYDYNLIAEKVKTLGSSKEWTKLTYEDMLKNSPSDAFGNIGLSTDTFTYAAKITPGLSNDTGWDTSTSTNEYILFYIFNSKTDADKFEALIQESKNNNPNTSVSSINLVRCSDLAVISYRLILNSDKSSPQNFDQEILGFCKNQNSDTTDVQVLILPECTNPCFSGKVRNPNPENPCACSCIQTNEACAGQGRYLDPATCECK